MFYKIRDFLDRKVFMIVILNTRIQVNAMDEVIKTLGKKRVACKLYEDDPYVYTMELRMARNRYLKLLKRLQKRNFTIVQNSEVGVIHRVTWFE